MLLNPLKTLVTRMLPDHLSDRPAKETHKKIVLVLA